MNLKYELTQFGDHISSLLCILLLFISTVKYDRAKSQRYIMLKKKG